MPNSLAGKWFGFHRDPDYDAGARFFEQGELEDAVAAFDRCIANGRDKLAVRLAVVGRIEASIALSDRLCAEGAPARAAEILEGSVQLQPDYADLHFRLAKCRGAAGDQKGRGEALEAALAINPNFAEAILHQGVLWITEGREEEGFARIERAIAIDNRFGGIAFRRALRAYREGKPEEVRLHLDELLSQSGDDVSRCLAQASLLAARGELVQASREYERAIAMAPRYPDIRCRYGQTLLELDLLSDAEAQFRVAIELNPNYAEPYAQLGLALRRQNREEEALAAFRSALKLDPSHVIAAEEVRRRR
ncbi:MAG: tetratricopeptide repeat protein [Fimbriimonadaceae bacterium]